jgi:glutamyl-tRNA synthetase
VRGEEWLPSAPAHVLIYRFLGWENEMPQYAHLPLLLKPDGNGKLSKRDGDRLGFPVFPLDWNDPFSGEKSSGYRERGYYPEAFVNMLAFLGWNPGTEQEIFSLEELAQAFSFDHIHKAGAKFDPEKAKWFNEYYLRATSSATLAANIRNDIQTTFGFAADDCRLSDEYLTQAVELLKPRVQFEHEMKTTGVYLFQAPTEYDAGVIAKKWKAELRPFFEALQTALMNLATFDAPSIDETLKATAASQNLKPGEVLQLFRVIISGQGGGVDLLGMIALIGRIETNERITRALQHIAQ